MVYKDPGTFDYLETLSSADMNVLAENDRALHADIVALEDLAPGSTYTYVNGGGHLQVAKPRIVRYNGSVSTNLNGDATFILTGLLATVSGVTFMAAGYASPVVANVVNANLADYRIRLWTGSTLIAGVSVAGLVTFHGTAP